MAYQNIPTGYQDTGPLGALWAGENAANIRSQNEMQTIADMFDNIKKKQDYQQNELMNPLRVQDLTQDVDTKSLANQFSRGSLSNRLAESDLAGDIAQQKRPFASDLAAGEVSDARGKKLAYEKTRDTQGGIIAETNSSNRFSTASRIATAAAAMDPVSGAAWIEANGASMDPMLKIGMKHALKTGTMDQFLKAMGGDPKTLRTESEAALDRKSRVQVANIQATAAISTSKNQIDASIQAAASLDFKAAAGIAEHARDSLKISIDQVQNHIDSLKNEGKRGPEFDALLRKKMDIEEQLKKAEENLLRVQKNIIDFYGRLNNPTKTNSNPTGKQGANGTEQKASGGTINWGRDANGLPIPLNTPPPAKSNPANKGLNSLPLQPFPPLIPGTGGARG